MNGYCPRCDKPLKRHMKNGKLVWICKTVTCLHYGKAPPKT